MSDIAIKVENLGKLYRLGEIGTGTISHDLNRWFARIRGKEDPFAKIGESNDRTSKSKGKSDYVWALQDMSFEIKKGEAVGIIGRNGAGKSTLLKLLSKVTQPSTGQIKINGRIASLLEVGTGFHPEMTGRENIFLNGAIMGMTKKEVRRKFDEIVDFAGVERYVDTPVKRYSSGMYVRLAFAVAAHLESEILIVDEVLAVGDAEFQKKCLGKMGDVSKGEGRTVLFVSHNMLAIQQLCDNSIVLNNGKVALIDSAQEGVRYYHELSNKSRISSNMSLSDRKDRTSGKVRFTNVIGIDNNKIEKWIFAYDEEIMLQFDFEVFEHVPDLLFYMAIKSSLSEEIITNSTHIVSQVNLNVGDKRRFIIHLPKNTLRPNQYELYFALGNTAKSIWYDVIDNNVNLPSLHITPISIDAHENTGFLSIATTLEIL